jgi:hypothetical protein
MRFAHFLPCILVQALHQLCATRLGCDCSVEHDLPTLSSHELGIALVDPPSGYSRGLSTGLALAWASLKAVPAMCIMVVEISECPSRHCRANRSPPFRMNMVANMYLSVCGLTRTSTSFALAAYRSKILSTPRRPVSAKARSSPRKLSRSWKAT